MVSENKRIACRSATVQDASTPREILEIPVAGGGDQIALAILNVGERPEAVDLQLEDEVVGVEWFGTP
jgi:hypothetical protein